MSDENWLLESQKSNYQVVNATNSRTFVGIDFGTSTTVVSIITVDENNVWHPETLQLKQPDLDGGTTEQDIINTVLYWKKDHLYFGQPAYKHKTKGKYGVDLFSSFKMDLGIDCGPTYPDSLLASRFGQPYTIETAKDAASYFFRFLIDAIKEEVASRDLPENIAYAVSVPASFRLSQRKDLLEALKNANVTLDSASFIDEPNAAFLSYFYQSWKEKDAQTLLDALNSSMINILVYDFGAGTCDISILRVGLKNGKLISRNLAISRFTALGGDNIDRAIAQKILYDQIKWEYKNGGNDVISESAKNETIIPRLMPIAERLKISMTNLLNRENIKSINDLDKLGDKCVYDKAQFIVKSKVLDGSIEPKMKVSDFKKIMCSFMDTDIFATDDKLCAPIHDAIEKSGITLDDLFGVLFIGGSCENPLIVNHVMSIMPDNVKSLIPYDLRAHVSQGAAIHSLGYNSFGYDFIQPVTSENINVVTTGEKLVPIIRASTPVPSEKFKIKLVVPRNNQTTIEIPICLSSPNHLLGVLSFSNPDGSAFEMGKDINITGWITREKMIDVDVLIDGISVVSDLLSPVSYEIMSEAKKSYWKAKKEFREQSVNFGRKNVSADTYNGLIEAAKACDLYAEITDLYRQMDTNCGIDCSIDISYYSIKAGDYALSKKWTKIAVERNPNSCTALFNYSLELSGNEKIEILRKSLSINDDDICSLILLGNELVNSGDNEEGMEMLHKAQRILISQLNSLSISPDYCERLIRLSIKLNDLTTLEKAQKFIRNHNIKQKKLNSVNKQYDKDNLVADRNNMSLSHKAGD